MICCEQSSIAIQALLSMNIGAGWGILYWNNNMLIWFISYFIDGMWVGACMCARAGVVLSFAVYTTQSTRCVIDNQCVVTYLFSLLHSFCIWIINICCIYIWQRHINPHRIDIGLVLWMLWLCIEHVIYVVHSLRVSSQASMVSTRCMRFQWWATADVPWPTGNLGESLLAWNRRRCTDTQRGEGQTDLVK